MSDGAGKGIAPDPAAARRLRRARIYRALFWVAMFIVFGGLTVDLWGWDKGHWSDLAAAITGGLLAVFGLTVLVLALIFRARLWPPNPRLDTLRALTSYLRRQLREARGRARGIDRHDMSVPWNLFIAFDKEPRGTAMAELGYVEFGDPIVHKGMTISTWASPTAIAYRVEIAETADPSFESLDALLDELQRNRPSLPVNAAFVEYELDALMSASAAAATNAATLNRVLNVACLKFGIDLPVHLILVGLEHMLDVSRAAFLSGLLTNERALGGFLDTQRDEDPGVAVDRLFDALIENLGTTQFTALQKQLAPEFCNSLLNAPMQLSLMKSQLRERLATLTQALPPRRRRLELHSVAFVGARNEMAGLDPLSQLVGSRFFGKPPDRGRSDSLRESVTAENAGLLAAGYHAEAYVVGQNPRLAFRQRARAGLLSALLIGGVAAYSLAVGENYLAYERVNRQLKQAFQTYYATVGDIGVTADTLVDRVLKLTTLRNGLQRYEVLDEQPHRQWLPSWSMEEMYRDLYETELLGGLQASLTDYLGKDVFAYNDLADGVTLIQLASLEAQFYSDQTRYADQLTQYFTLSFAEQGEISLSFQTAFKNVLADLFALNRPPAARNEELRQVVARTLQGLDSSDLLYLSLMRRPEYAERQDLRTLIGARYNEVFDPIDKAQVYLVPRAFTGRGFERLFGSNGNIPDLDDLIDNYEAVVGPLDPSERNSITRRIATRYTSDYIGHWTDFITALRLREAEGWGDAQILMRALTDQSENPINRMVDALKENTDLRVYLPPEPVPEPVAGVPAAAPPPLELAPATFSAEASAAASIRIAFRKYIDAATATGPEGKSQLDLFLEYARNVTIWLEEAAGAAGGAGPYLFDLYSLDERTTPLSVLATFSARSQLEIIRTFGRGISRDLDEAAMGFVFDHINAQWRQQILEPYAAELMQSFPFDPGSAADLSLDVFADLFGPEGKLPAFQTTYLAQFRAPDGGYEARATFLLDGTAQITDEAAATFERIARIADTMFVDGKPFLEFQLRTGYMDSGLSRLQVSGGQRLHQFTHGPPRWDAQVWPADGGPDSRISLRFYQRSRAVFDQTYEGVWSWFRMVRGGSAGLNPSLNMAEVTFFGNGGQRATLQFDLAKRHSPFVPGFFSSLQLPDVLF